MTDKKYEPLAITAFVMSFFVPLVSIIVATTAAKKIVDTNHIYLQGRRLIFASLLISTIPYIAYIVFRLREYAKSGYVFYVPIAVALLISLSGTSAIYSMIKEKKWLRHIAANWTVLLIAIPLITILFILQSLPF